MYAGIMDDEDLLAEELGFFTAAGGSAIVDVTNIGIGRNPEGLLRLARATGLHVVMGAGWYRERVYPKEIYELTTNALADAIIREFERGVGDSGVRPGIIGEIGTERFRISPAEERVFRAAARAQRQVGAAITTHTTHFGELALEQVALLTEEGVAPGRIIVGHVGERRGIEDVMRIARTGVFVEVDHVGRPTSAGTQPEQQRARNVAAVVAAGFRDQLLISMDICSTSYLRWYGGHGFDHLLRTFVPLLLKEGLTEEDVRVILVENPKRALRIDPGETEART